MILDQSIKRYFVVELEGPFPFVGDPDIAAVGGAGFNAYVRGKIVANGASALIQGISSGGVGGV